MLALLIHAVGCAAAPEFDFSFVNSCPAQPNSRLTEPSMQQGMAVFPYSAVLADAILGDRKSSNFLYIVMLGANLAVGCCSSAFRRNYSSWLEKKRGHSLDIILLAQQHASPNDRLFPSDMKLISIRKFSIPYV
jgi:hypothetical protein